MKRQPGITFSGPFFEKDVKKTFRDNARKLIEGMVREGATAVAGAMHRVSGRTAAGVVGRVKSLSGKPWMLTGVISQTRIFPWKSGGQRQYRGGRLEASQHQFRRTKSALMSSRAAATADLSKGLN